VRKLLGVWIVVVVAAGVLTALAREPAATTFEAEGPIQLVEVETDAGSVVVLGRDGDGATIRRRASRLPGPDLDERLEAGVLRLRAECPGWALLGCRASYQVEVAAGVQVRAVSRAGSVRVDGITGPVRAESDAGNVRLAGLSGTAFARTDAGRITGERLASAALDAGSGAGGVRLEFSRPPDVVVVETGAGSIDVALPAGRYRVSAESGTGGVDVSITVDPSAAATVTARSGAGDVRVRPATG
jgi:hypothetical protein